MFCVSSRKRSNLTCYWKIVHEIHNMYTYICILYKHQIATSFDWKSKCVKASQIAFRSTFDTRIIKLNIEFEQRAFESHKCTTHWTEINTAFTWFNTFSPFLKPIISISVTYVDWIMWPKWTIQPCCDRIDFSGFLPDIRSIPFVKNVLIISINKLFNSC